MISVPVVIALFNGNHGESAMCIPTDETVIWDESRGEVVISLAEPSGLDSMFAKLREAIDVAFQIPSIVSDPIPVSDEWVPPGWDTT